MPTLRVCTFVCDVCGAEFGGNDYSAALAQAKACEDQGFLYDFRFDFGEVVRFFLFADDAVSACIIRRGAAPKTHDPVYWVISAQREEIKKPICLDAKKLEYFVNQYRGQQTSMLNPCLQHAFETHES